MTETKLIPRQRPQNPPKLEMKSNQVILGERSNSAKQHACELLTKAKKTNQRPSSQERRDWQQRCPFHMRCTEDRPLERKFWFGFRLKRESHAQMKANLCQDWEDLIRGHGLMRVFFPDWTLKVLDIAGYPLLAMSHWLVHHINLSFHWCLLIIQFQELSCSLIRPWILGQTISKSLD